MATSDRQRRTGDRGWRRLVRENSYRDVWLLVVTLLVAYTAFQTMRSVDQVTTGRRVAIGVTCGVANAVINAGRATIATPRRYPPAVERRLRAIGFPSYRERRRAAAVNAHRYGDRIAGAVARSAGPQSVRVIRPDGTLDCERFRQVANAQDN